MTQSDIGIRRLPYYPPISDTYTASNYTTATQCSACVHTHAQTYIIFIANIYSTVGRSIADRSGKWKTSSN